MTIQQLLCLEHEIATEEKKNGGIISPEELVKIRERIMGKKFSRSKNFE